MRWLAGGAAALGALVLIAAGVLWRYLDEVARSALERGGEASIGASTTVGGLSVRPLSGRIELERVRIANPPGFSDEAFLALGTGRIQVDLPSLRSNAILLPIVALREVHLRLEKVGGRANYDALGSSEPVDVPAEQATPEVRRVVVRELTIDDVTAYLGPGVVPGSLRAREVAIPRIVLRDVGSGPDRGVVASELSRIVIDAVLVALACEGIRLPGALVASVGRFPLRVLGSVEQRLVGAETNVAREAGGAAGRTLDRSADAIKKGIGSLIGRDDPN